MTSYYSGISQFWRCPPPKKNLSIYIKTMISSKVECSFLPRNVSLQNKPSIKYNKKKRNCKRLYWNMNALSIQKAFAWCSGEPNRTLTAPRLLSNQWKKTIRCPWHLYVALMLSWTYTCYEFEVEWGSFAEAVIFSVWHAFVRSAVRAVRAKLQWKLLFRFLSNAH